MTYNFEKELVLLKSPQQKETLPPDIQDILAKQNGWKKVHMKQIKKDDPFRKRLLLNNPDGMYYVDENGYYVTPEKWELAKKNLYMLINYENPLASRTLNIDHIYSMKFGGSIRKFLYSGKFELASPITANIPTNYAEMYGILPEIDPSLPINHIYNIHNAIALLNGWIKVKVKNIDLDANREWEDIIRQKDPEDSYIVDPTTRKIIPEKVFEDYMKTMPSEDEAIRRTAFEVLQAQNHRELQRKDTLDLAKALILPGAAAIPGGIPLLFTAYETLKAGQALLEGDYWAAAGHAIGAAIPYSGQLARGAYLVVGKIAPRIVTRYIAPLTLGTALTAALEQSNARKLENIPEISEDFLREGNYTQKEVHEELKRLNYTTTPTGNNDATQVIVEGNAGVEEPPSDLEGLITNILIGHGLNITPVLLAKIPRLGAWIRERWPKLIKWWEAKGFGTKLLMSQIPSFIWDVVQIADYFIGDNPEKTQSPGERAYILINYLNNMASDTKGYYPHAVYPSTFSKELRSGKKYPGYTVNDSIALMKNAEQTDSTNYTREPSENDSAWYDLPEQ